MVSKTNILLIASGCLAPGTQASSLSFSRHLVGILPVKRSGQIGVGQFVDQIREGAHFGVKTIVPAKIVVGSIKSALAEAKLVAQKNGDQPQLRVINALLNAVEHIRTNISSHGRVAESILKIGADNRLAETILTQRIVSTLANSGNFGLDLSTILTKQAIEAGLNKALRLALNQIDAFTEQEKSQIQTDLGLFSGVVSQTIAVVGVKHQFALPQIIGTAATVAGVSALFAGGISNGGEWAHQLVETISQANLSTSQYVSAEIDYTDPRGD